jgi:hypothetical protein
VSATETLEGTVEEEADVPEPRAVEIAVVPKLAVTPSVQAEELVARLAVIKEAMETAMVRDVDYGVIPGTKKPTLLKPGAEKLGVLFQLDVQLSNEKTWGPGDHLTVTTQATVFHAPTGARLGYGEGMCTTREKKYAKRREELLCPGCGKANVRRSRNAGEGFYCWRKTDGCGATFPENDERITGQVAGDVDNPDLPDSWNTVLKMAGKRGRIDAVLAVTGASALFTQDLEDGPREPADEPPPAAPPAPQGLPLDRVEALVDLVVRAIDDEAMPAPKMVAHLVALGATDTSSFGKAIHTLTEENAQAFETLLNEALGVKA